MSAPWMKFYPRDWRGDQALRAVSLSARGLWVEMLTIMHEASPYGHLILGGRGVSNDVLARMAGASMEEVGALLSELESAGVFSRTRKDVIYSRRMVKDHSRSEKGRKSVKRRWEQTADNQKENDQPNRSPNRHPITQKPEARGSVSNDTGEPPNIPKMIFDLGIGLLVAAGHKDREARSILGKWRRDFGDSAVLSALLDCQAKNIANPVEWMPKRLKARPASFLSTVKPAA
jgi:hypothetical protein